MQPYIFPYVGYFQLINATDKFIFYEDVSFIKQGWINRNRILLNGKEHMFSVPLKGISSFRNINEVETDTKTYLSWKRKFYKTLEFSYSKAPFFESVYPLVRNVLDKDDTSISELAMNSVVNTAEYLLLPVAFSSSADTYGNEELAGQNRVMDICLKEKASDYINPIGGEELYSKEEFAKSGISLQFIKPGISSYSQYHFPFVPGLSIIDVMMFNSAASIREMLNNCTII